MPVTTGTTCALTMLTSDQLATMLQVAKDTLRKYRKDPVNPLPSVGRGTGRRYELEAVKCWLNRRADVPMVAALAHRLPRLPVQRVHF